MAFTWSVAKVKFKAESSSTSDFAFVGLKYKKSDVRLLHTVAGFERVPAKNKRSWKKPTQVGQPVVSDHEPRRHEDDGVVLSNGKLKLTDVTTTVGLVYDVILAAPQTVPC